MSPVSVAVALAAVVTVVVLVVVVAAAASSMRRRVSATAASAVATTEACAIAFACFCWSRMSWRFISALWELVPRDCIEWTETLALRMCRWWLNISRCDWLTEPSNLTFLPSSPSLSCSF